jgi:NAD(P)-dependent dehydrogenase (short-subunit alcohol dehydrogenase family)
MKNAMVWGAAGGIGRALVSGLKAEGWTVVALGRHDETVAGLADCAIGVDVSDPIRVRNAVAAAAYEVSDVALWVYSAGDIVSAPVADMSPETWSRIVGANLGGAYLATHYSLPLLASDAHLVYLGAVSERLRLPGLSAYAAAKAGLEAFAEALRKEQRGRRVTVVRPGAVATPFWDKVPLRLPKDAAPPEKAAARILAAHAEGHSGVLDLV